MADYAAIEALRVQLRDAQIADKARSEVMRRVLREAQYPTFDALAFLEVLQGRPLRDLAGWRYTAPEKPPAADSARGPVVLTNASTTARTFALGELVLEHASSGKRYRNTIAGTLRARASTWDPTFPTLTLNVEAEEPGAASTAGPSTITTIVEPASLPGVTVTNPKRLVGRDAGGELEFRTGLRSSDDLSRLVRGVLRSDGSSAGATRARRVGDVVSIATATGAIAGPDLEVVRAALRPATLRAGAISATPLPVAFSYTLTVLDEYNVPGVPDPVPTPVASSATLQAAITARLAAFFPTLPIGPTTIPVGVLETVVRSALGLRVDSLSRAAVRELATPYGATHPTTGDPITSALVSLSITSPAITLGAHDVATLGTITPTVVRV